MFASFFYFQIKIRHKYCNFNPCKFINKYISKNYNQSMDIQQLIGLGKIDAALMLLPQTTEVIMLKSRLHSIERNAHLGMISFQDASMQRNQIVHAILHLADNANINSTSQFSISRPTVVGDFNEAALMGIVVNNKRRRIDIAEEAQKILNDYRSYKDSKAQTPTFDPANRRFKALQEAANQLINRLEAEKENDLVKTVERIAVLLEEPIPTYDQLNEAYNLACGRGFKKTYIEQQLQNRPDDEEVRIIIAEEIEGFAATLGK